MSRPNRLPLKYVVNINQHGMPEKTPPDTPIRYIDISACGRGKLVAEPEPMMFGSAPSRARRQVRPGDTIVSTVRTYLRAVWPVEGRTEDLVVSTGFAVISPKPTIDARYLSWLIQSDVVIEEIVARSVGVSYPAINASEIGAIVVPLPEISEQRAIAGYLDAETARIDRVVAVEQARVRTSQERLVSAVEAAVLGRSGAATVVNAPDGPLLPPPGHWEARRNKTFMREVIDLSETGEEELLTVSHLTGVTPRNEKVVYMFLAESNEGYKRVQPGDLVINTMWAWMGALGVSRNPGIVSPAYGVYRFTAPDVEPRYFDALFRTPAYVAEMTRYSTGVWTSRLRLYPDSFLGLSAKPHK